MKTGILVCCVAVMIAVGGCVVERVVTVEEVLGVELVSVDEVVLRSGTTGEAVHLTGLQVQEFLEIVGGLTLTRSGDQSARTGYQFYADLHADGEQVGRITFASSRIDIEGTQYEADEAIDEDTFQGFFE